MKLMPTQHTKSLLKGIPFLLVFLALFSCSGPKNVTSKPQVLTEKQRLEEADLFIKALREKELGNLDKALDLYTQALQINPEDAAALYEQARILSAIGRKDEALASCKTACQLAPDNKWYKMLYGNLAKANEKYKEYVLAYEQLVEAYPNDLNFLNELSFAYRFVGDYQKAIVVLDKIEEIIGSNENLVSQKVQLYDQIGDQEGAIAAYEKLISLNEDVARHYAMLAEYCSKNKLYEKAIEAYQKIVEINPDDPYVHISLADFYQQKGEMEKSFDELKIGLANPKLDLKTKINLLVNYYQGELSEQQKKQALELSEIIKETHPDDVFSETFYASMLYENKDYRTARDIFHKILKKEKANYAIWEQTLFCDLYLEDYTQLAKDSEEAIDYFPSYPLPYFFAGIGNFQMKDYVKAKAFLESGKEFVVNNNALLEQFYSTLGDTYHELKQYEASYAAYDKVLAISPDNSLVLNNYAYYLSLQAVQLDKAERMAFKSVGLDPYNHNNLDTYAWVLYQRGKYEEALEWIKKAYGNGGQDSGVVLEHYGDILYQLGKKEEALGFWEKAKQKTDYSPLLDKKISEKALYE